MEVRAGDFIADVVGGDTSGSKVPVDLSHDRQTHPVPAATPDTYVVAT